MGSGGGGEGAISGSLRYLAGGPLRNSFVTSSSSYKLS